VIDALSRSLRKVLQTEIPDVHIVFDHPTESFKPSQTTIDLFLYDVRENAELRSNEPTIERSNGMATIVPPPLRVACSYLLTAWPAGEGELPLVEHQLLGQALMKLARHPTIPEEFLEAPLNSQAPPLPLMMTRADGLKEPHEFWTAIGNKLRPSITVCVTIGMEMEILKPKKQGIVVAHDVRLDDSASRPEHTLEGAAPRGPFSVAGRVTDSAGKPVVGATVSLPGASLSSTTDEDGWYFLRGVARGPHILKVEQQGKSQELLSITVPAPRGGNNDLRVSS